MRAESLATREQISQMLDAMTRNTADHLSAAVANVIDRAADGQVTDYLHTGWFPTFNLADVFVVTGAAVLVLASWRASDTADTGADE